MEQQEQLPVETQADQNSETHESEQLVADEKLIELFGLPKDLIGQPIDKVANVVKSTRKELTKKQQELSELKKTQVKPQTTELKAPDPLNFQDVADYQRALDEYVDKKVEQKFQPYRENQVAQQTHNVMQSIQSRLPSGMDANDIAQEWAESTNFNVQDAYLLNGNAKFIEESIINYAEAKKLKEINTLLTKEQNDVVAEKIRKSLSKNPVDYDLNSIDRTKSTKDGVVQRILKRQELEKNLTE